MNVPDAVHEEKTMLSIYHSGPGRLNKPSIIEVANKEACDEVPASKAQYGRGVEHRNFCCLM